MKKILAYVMSLVAVTTILSSCGSKTTPTPTTLGVDFINPPTALVGGVYKVTVKFTAPDKIDRLELSIVETKKDGNVVTTPVKDFPKTSGFSTDTEHIVYIEYKPGADVASFIITGLVKDKKNATASKSIDKFTIGAAGAGDISPATVTLLGSQDNATDPSFYATSTLTAYKQADAKANSAVIDFGFGTGAAAGNEFFIGSPMDGSVAAIYNNVTTGVQAWTPRLNTTFKATTLDAAGFDAIATSAALGTAFDAGTDAAPNTRVKAADTAVGKVFGFQTQAGKKGLVKVTNRTANSISLVIKVQK